MSNKKGTEPDSSDEAGGTAVDAGVDESKLTRPGLEAVETGVDAGFGGVGDGLLGFKILSQQTRTDFVSDNTLADQCYTVSKSLPDGRFSELYEATDKTAGTHVVMKRYNKLKWGEVLWEVLCLERCKHKHVVQLMDVITGSFHTTLIFRFAGQKLLPDTAHHGAVSYDRREKVIITRQMLTALAFLHEKSVIHQDVRPGNILVHSWPIHVSLSDFSNCTISGDAFVGRPWSEQAAAHVTYTAPELLMGCRCIDESVDMWSCGLVVLRLYWEKPVMNEKTAAGVLRCLPKILGSPSSEDISIMETYPAWQSHYARYRKQRPTAEIHDLNALVWQLLRWSPGRPSEFNHKAITHKAIHMEFIL